LKSSAIELLTKLITSKTNINEDKKIERKRLTKQVQA